MRTGSFRMCVLAALAGLLMAAPAGAQPLLAPDSPLGAHAMLYFDTPLGADEAMFAQAGAEHAGTVRLDVFMPQITNGDARRDWSWVRRIAMLARRYRLRVLADLTGMPARMAACPPNQPPAHTYRCPARNPAAWGELAGEVAGKLRGIAATFEIWNEPDGSWTFQGSAQQYGQLLAASVAAIHRASPGAAVTNGGIENPPNLSGWAWVETALVTGGRSAWQNLDVLNIQTRGDESTLVSQLQLWRSFAAANGRPHIPIWISEAGYPADAAFQTDPRYHGGAPAQAAYVAAALRDLYAAGAAKIFITQRDLGAGSGPFASEGVLAGLADPVRARPRVRRRPAWYACRAFAMQAQSRERASA